MAESQLRGATSEVSAQVGKMKMDQESLRKEILLQRKKLNEVQHLSDPCLLIRREHSSVQDANRALELTVANLARATGGVQTGVGSARATGGVQTGVRSARSKIRIGEWTHAENAAFRSNAQVSCSKRLFAMTQYAQTPANSVTSNFDGQSPCRVIFRIVPTALSTKFNVLCVKKCFNSLLVRK
eukprot:862821_1